MSVASTTKKNPSNKNESFQSPSYLAESTNGHEFSPNSNDTSTLIMDAIQTNHTGIQEADNEINDASQNTMDVTNDPHIDPSACYENKESFRLEHFNDQNQTVAKQHATSIVQSIIDESVSNVVLTSINNKKNKENEMKNQTTSQSKIDSYSPVIKQQMNEKVKVEKSYGNIEGITEEIEVSIENYEQNKKTNNEATTSSSKLTLRKITPIKKLKAIFELDPSNQYCADCETRLDLNDSEDVFLSFQYSVNKNHPSVPSSESLSLTSSLPKNYPYSKIWNHQCPSDFLPVSDKNSLPPNSSSLESSSIDSIFPIQHALFSPFIYPPSVTFSVFICYHCAQVHRSILSLSKNNNHNRKNLKFNCVKHIQNKRELWTLQEIACLEANKGNDYANSLLERYMPPAFKNRFSVNHIKSNDNKSPNTKTSNTDDSDNTNEVTDNNHQYYIGGGIHPNEREVFVRSKYEALAFLLPIGPLTCDDFHNDKKDTWLKYKKDSPFTGIDKGRQRVLQSQILPQRLVDFFCVFGANGELHPSFQNLLQDENKMKDSITSWDQVVLDAKLLDCYPPPMNDKGTANFYPNMSFPDHVEKFAFPEGCHPIANQPKPTFFTFVLTLETGVRLYGSCLHIYDQIFNPKSYNGLQNLERHLPFDSDDPLHIPKALILFSHYPFFDVFRGFLLQLYRISRTPSSPLPLERYIANFTREIPLPPRGKVEIHLGFSDDFPLIKIMRPPVNKLPMIDLSYRPLFTFLSPSNVMVIFGCLLQESRVVICSSHYSLLTPVCESLLSFLYPFVWQGCYIPVMPDDMLDVLQAPFPFLIGIHSRFLRHGQERPHGVVFVDVDSDIVHLGYDEIDPGSHDLKEYGRPTPALPEKSATKLKTVLEEYVQHLYIMPRAKVKGRITYGENSFMANEERENYARALTPEEKAASGGFSSVSFHGHDDSIKDTRNRTDAFKEIDFPFQNDEFKIPITTFKTESGTMLSASSPKSKIEKKSLISRKKSKNNSRKSPLNRNLFDKLQNEATDGIRNGFFRFFVSLFLNYEKFIVTPQGNRNENVNFNASSFLNELNTSVRCREFISKILSSQMFERFIEERVTNPEQPEVLFFHDSIVAKNNRSMSKKTKPTPFLDDQSGEISDIFYPPLPSNWGLPDDNRTYFYRQFPKFKSELFGKIRQPQQWAENLKRRRQMRIPSSVIHQRKAMSLLVDSNERWRSLNSFGPSKEQNKSRQVINVPSWNRRDTLWAIHALAYKYTEEDEKVQPLSPELLLSARSILLYACQKQLILLCVIVKLQSFVRMYITKSSYLYLRSKVVFVQRQRRKTVHIRKHGKILNFYISKAKLIQKSFRGYSTRNFRKKQCNASILIQKNTRVRLAITFISRLKRSTIKVQSFVRMWRAQLGKKLLIYMVKKCQANIRGWLDRNAITEFKNSRRLEYRKQLVQLWRKAHVSLEFRSKFWTIVDGSGFMNLGLHEAELMRLWDILDLGKKDDNLLDSTYSEIQIRTLKGLPNTFYHKFLKIQAKLNLESQSTISNSDRSTSTSNSFLGGLTKFSKGYPKNNVEVVFLQDTASKSSVIHALPSLRSITSFSEELQESYKHLAFERLNVYERLSSCSFTERETVYQRFGLPATEKKKKQKIAKILWESYELADKSAKFILSLNDTSTQLRFSSAPSKKGLKRFGIANLPTQQSLFDVTTSEISKSLWAQELLEKRIKYDLTQTINAFINGVQGLLSRIDRNDRSKSSSYLRQCNALKGEERLHYVRSFLYNPDHN